MRRRRRFASPSASLLSVTGEASGLYRVSDSTVQGYEIFRGVDGAAIDFDAAPWQTTASIPVIYPAPTSDHRYEFVVRYRNAYGLTSRNVAAMILDIDGSGDERAVNPSAPDYVLIERAAGGTAIIRAGYLYLADGDDAADTWLIYLRSNGTDPDPAIDTPIEETMGTSDGEARLEYTAGPYTEGALVRVIVRTRRSGTPDVDSTNSDVHSVAATLLGPSAPTGKAFLGETAEQTQ
jgi:hypothetical protein